MKLFRINRNAKCMIKLVALMGRVFMGKDLILMVDSIREMVPIFMGFQVKALILTNLISLRAVFLGLILKAEEEDFRIFLETYLIKEKLKLKILPKLS